MILHAVPSFIAPSEYGAGNWKAVEATRIALEHSGLRSDTVMFDEHEPSTLLRDVTDETRHVLIEYSNFPDLLTELRAKFPGLGVHVRTHNAEPFQHVSRETGDGWRDYARVRMWKRAARLLLNDVRCRRSADTLLGISEWDDRHYWRWLPGKAAVRLFPYFSPWPHLRPGVEPQPWDQRRPVIASMGGNFDPSGLANVANFQALADQLPGASGTTWSFLLTWWNQWHDDVPPVSEPVEIVRDLREPWDLLCGVRALAVMTPLGFGLKTTVIDGLAAGCHVIVHPRLVNRLPADVAEFCLAYDPAKDDIGALAEALDAPPQGQRLNDRIRDTAADVLRTTFASHHGVPQTH